MQDKITWKTYLPSLLVLIVGISITFALAWSQLEREQIQSQMRFERDAMVYSDAIQKEISRSRDVVDDLAALFKARAGVTREEFSVFAQVKLSQHTGIQALEWIPKVAHHEREAFVNRARETFSDFQFRDLRQSGEFAEAAKQDYYFPVYYLEPLAGNEAALGLTPSYSKERDETIKAAINRNQTIASRRMSLVQEHQNQFGLLIFSPVIKGEGLQLTYEEKFSNLTGFALGVFRIGDLVENALANQKKMPLHLLLLDKSTQTSEDFWYFHHYEGQHDYEKFTYDQTQFANQYVNRFKQLGRDWQVEIYPYKNTYSPVLSRVYLIAAIGILATLVASGIVFRWRQALYKKEQDLSDSVEQKQSTIDLKDTSLLRQNNALTHLTCNLNSVSKSLNGTLADITETAANTLNVERVSSWFFSDDKGFIYCHDLYEQSCDRHSKGTELRHKKYPAYFDALLKGDAIVANQAADDARTCEFKDDYLKPLNITSMLDIPVRHKGEVVGVLCVEHVGEQRDWTIEEIHFATAIANFICLAVESVQRRQAEQRLRQTSERLSLINCIASSIRAGMSVEQVINAALMSLAHEFQNYRLSYATISKEGSLKVVACKTLGSLPDTNGLCVDLTSAPEYLASLLKKQPLVISDVTTDYRFESLQPLLHKVSSKALLDTPLNHYDDLVGVICLETAAPHHWKQHEILIMQEVAEFLELAIRNAKGQEARREAEEALEHQKAVLERLVKERTSQLEYKAQLELIVANLSTKFINLPTTDFDQGIYEALKTVGEFCGVERCVFIEVFDEQNSGIKNYEWLAPGIESKLPRQQEFRLNQFPWIYDQLRDNNIVYFRDISEMPEDAKDDQGMLLYLQVRSIALIPVVYAMKLSGVLSLNTQKVTKHWSEDDLNLFQLVGNMLINVTERKKYDEELKRSEALLLNSNKKLKDLATIDGLTGIPNRRFFDLRLQSEYRRAQREQFPLAVIFFDIDYFKLFNDEFGHVAGDLCLKRVANTIKDHCQRASELAARYGGEEFVVILANISSDGALALAERIRNAVQGLMIDAPTASESNFLTISGGIACMVPPLETTAEDLLRVADKALYEAKSSGRNCVKLAGDSTVVKINFNAKGG